jgi:hypothetical protein
VNKKISEKAPTQRGEVVGLMKVRRRIPQGGEGKKTGVGQDDVSIEMG